MNNRWRTFHIVLYSIDTFCPSIIDQFKNWQCERGLEFLADGQFPASSNDIVRLRQVFYVVSFSLVLYTSGNRQFFIYPMQWC